MEIDLSHSLPLLLRIEHWLHFFSETQGTDPTDLGTFIIDVVQRFSPTQLQGTQSKDTQSRIMEAQWQQEFYRAAASLLPHDAVISLEYGKQQAQGQVDFYISKYRWDTDPTGGP
jgi:hypothetical protein